MTCVSDEDSTYLGLTAGDRNWVIGIGAVGGIAIGLLLPVVWTWIKDWPLPFHGVFEAIMSISAPAVAVLRPIVLGLAGGVALALWAWSQPKLRISETEIEIDHNDQTRVVRRDQVGGVYLRGSTLVIDGIDGRKLFEHEVEGAKKKAGSIFRDRGYPWEMRD